LALMPTIKAVVNNDSGPVYAQAPPLTPPRQNARRSAFPRGIITT
jgi:hypothetical protein